MQRTRIAKVKDVEAYVWQANAGHYCWEVRNDEGVVGGGGGYEDAHEAELDALDEFYDQTQRVLH